MGRTQIDSTGTQVPADLTERQNERFQQYYVVAEKQNRQEIEHFLDSFFFLEKLLFYDSSNLIIILYHS